MQSEWIESPTPKTPSNLSISMPKTPSDLRKIAERAKWAHINERRCCDSLILKAGAEMAKSLAESSPVTDEKEKSTVKPPA
jgi:hypothetical protein